MPAVNDPLKQLEDYKKRQKASKKRQIKKKVYNQEFQTDKIKPVSKYGKSINYYFEN